jgi:hypothetical protein
MDSPIFLLRILAPFLISWITTLASPPPQLEKALDLVTESPFQLTMSIDKESYSTVPDVIDGAKRPHRQLVLDLKLHFTNQSDRVVRVDKNCVHLSSTIVYDIPIVGPLEPLIPDDEMPSDEMISGWPCPCVVDDKFIAIPREGFFESTLRLKFKIVEWGAIRPPKILKPGKYFLKITVGTWWEIDGQNEKWKELRKKGVQFELPVTSELMGFVVAGKPIKRLA